MADQDNKQSNESSSSSSENIEIPPISKQTAGAAAGAVLGSVAGPVGAVVGGVIGAAVNSQRPERLIETRAERDVVIRPMG